MSETDPDPLPPGQLDRYTGPWFSTQLTLSLVVGLTSFVGFCFLRKIERFKVLYTPRTLLKGFTPHEAHDKESLLGWILPTLRTSEFTVLQIVGLDAAVLLSFLRTCFLLFVTWSVVGWAVLVPINFKESGSSEGIPPPPPDDHEDLTALMFKKAYHGSNLFLTTHLVFTYLFTAIAIWFLNRNYAKFIPLRQLFSLEHAHSVPARTVMVSDLPVALRNEKALADYFQSIHLGHSDESSALKVESVDLVRAVGSMKELLQRRERALRRLEQAWATYLDNPVRLDDPQTVKNYDPEYEVERIYRPDDATRSTANGHAGAEPLTDRLVDVEDEREREEEDDIEAALLSPPHDQLVNPKKPRPTIRPWLFGKKVDALDHYAEQFRLADRDVKKRRQAKFRPTGVAFVTFESLAAAQVAAQVAHYHVPSEFRTEMAPEPRDIQWDNLNHGAVSWFVRNLLAILVVLVLLSVWSVPVLFLGQLLSWSTITKTAPRLAEWIDKYPRIRALVQTSLPSLSLVIFNNFLPFFLGYLSHFQGLQARSWVEYSLLKKYHISILFTTLFVFITASSYRLLQDISDSPTKVLDKLATVLPIARNFFVSYIMLAGIALMPLQLLELPTVIPRVVWRALFTRTPRDFAELNNPPMINLGIIYPQALLIFTVGATYSVIMPLILPFAAIYFGLTYLVYKYKLLFVIYRPYESRGQAWPLAFVRMGWGLVIFQIFMLGLFIFRKAILLAGLVVPLICATIYTFYRLHHVYHPLSTFVNLSQASEITNGGASDIAKLRQGQPVTRGQGRLNRERYRPTDEGIYVVARSESTDYAQPPMSDMYPGVLNTGRKRYGHPALNGSLPDPWLPIIAEPRPPHELAGAVKDALVLDLRRQWRRLKRAASKAVPGVRSSEEPSSFTNDDNEGGDEHGTRPSRRRSKKDHMRRCSLDEDDPSKLWRSTYSQASEDAAPIGHSYSDNEDNAHDEDEDDEAYRDEDEDTIYEGDSSRGLSRYSTYWPARSKAGHDFPPSHSNEDTHSDRS